MEWKTRIWVLVFCLRIKWLELNVISKKIVGIHYQNEWQTRNSTWTPSSTEQCIWPTLFRSTTPVKRQINNSNWDESIDDDTAQKWLKWRNNLMTFDGKSRPLCQRTLIILSIVLYTISQMHVKVDMVSLAISDCLIKGVKYIAPCW